MRNLALALFLSCLFLAPSFGFAQLSAPRNNWRPPQNEIAPGPVQKDTYGPGIWSDSTGQPFQWKTQDRGLISPFSNVKGDAYGPGVGMDEYGRPVKAFKLFDQ